MIFVTVGTQLPFDRLVMTVDDWAKTHQDVEVYAQTGTTDKKPLNIRYADFVNPGEAEELFKKATLIVSHAGVGSILSALKYRKPIIIMPRRASLGEHRNEHQMATAKWVADRNGIQVAWDEQELMGLLDHSQSIAVSEGISEYASQTLIDNLKQFISTQ